MLTPEQTFTLGRFRYAAFTIDRWLRMFGKERTKNIVIKMMQDDYITDEYRASLATAFGE